ncbi:MAG: MerC family mercury resistance protein [Bacteriovoracaceae bacterium]|nr:MerC family mercury resistance protein [Bacteriovoracaceae bacterium]
MLVDHLGIGVSALCLIHCLFLPLVIIFFPAIKLATSGIDAHFHEILFFLILIISLLSFIPT